jgi:hypothetical protein
MSMTPQTLLAETLDHATPDWRAEAEKTLMYLATTGREFTANDLTSLGVPPPDHPNRWGALFNSAARQGLIRSVGFRQSARPSRAGGVCRIWIGV